LVALESTFLLVILIAAAIQSMNLVRNGLKPLPMYRMGQKMRREWFEITFPLKTNIYVRINRKIFTHNTQAVG
jgi:hypothetical protein